MTHRVNLRLTAAVIPLLLVNCIAMFGQLAFIRSHIHWLLAGDILFAASLESVAVYLAYHAHIALISNYSALRLRLASYGFGLLIGILNYSHYSATWRPTFEAIAVGLLSASSPWLWGIHSRRESRDILLAKGLIEPHAVRLGANRWLWHPLRCVIVMSHATWAGEQDVMRALALVPKFCSVQAETQSLPAETLVPSGASKANAVRAAIDALSPNGSVPNASDVVAWLEANAAPEHRANTSYVRDVMRRDAASESTQMRNGQLAKTQA